MKKQYITLLLVIVLSAVAVWLVIGDHGGTIKQELKDFAVEDTASITRVRLADRQGNVIDLKRNPDGLWIVNDRHPVRQDAIDNLLTTFKQVQVKSPVSNAEFENTVKVMAGTATRVEVYQGDEEPSKVIYVGGSTKDTFGTYMMMENSSTPFITHIPGMYGYLSTRFFLDEEAWRSAIIFKYMPKEIKRIRVDHTVPDRSFEITGINDGEPRLTNLETGEVLKNIDTLAIYDYVNLFRSVSAEYFATTLISETRMDSILNNKLFTISVEDTGGETKTLTGYLNQLATPFINVEGDTLHFDVDRGYGRISGSEDVLVIQHFVFDPLTPIINKFRRLDLVKN